MDKMDNSYELLREVWTVTEWKDGAIFATRLERTEWVTSDVLDGNRPKETNLIYAVMSTSYTGPTIRTKKS